MKLSDERLNWKKKVIKKRINKKLNSNKKNNDQIGNEFFLKDT
jgi:hypothetical protein